MKDNKYIFGFTHRPKVITEEDRIRLKELLKVILFGTSLGNDDLAIEHMMKSTKRVVCLKFIESIVAVHEFPNHDVISKFFDVYFTDINARMKLKCNVDKEFRFNDFIIHRSLAMKLCLVMGEMVTNSFNQAVGSRKTLVINHTCGFTTENGKQVYTFFYKDNGKGFTESVDLRNTTTQWGIEIAFSIATFLEVEPVMAVVGGFGYMFKFIPPHVN